MQPVMMANINKRFVDLSPPLAGRHERKTQKKHFSFPTTCITAPPKGTKQHCCSRSYWVLTFLSVPLPSIQYLMERLKLSESFRWVWCR